MTPEEVEYRRHVAKVFKDLTSRLAVTAENNQNMLYHNQEMRRKIDVMQEELRKQDSQHLSNLEQLENKITGLRKEVERLKGVHGS